MGNLPRGGCCQDRADVCVIAARSLVLRRIPKVLSRLRKECHDRLVMSARCLGGRGGGGGDLVAKSCLTLCEPVGCSPPGSSVRGLLLARILEWVAISVSSGWELVAACIS